MNGNKGVGLVIQERDRRLLRELGHLRVIDREQAKVFGGFSSTTQVNARLLALTQAGLRVLAQFCLIFEMPCRKPSAAGSH
jgi:hypothetical protein